MNDIREATLHGLRPDRTVRMAATKYLQDYAQQKKSIGDDAIQLLDPIDQNFERGARRRAQSFESRRLRVD